MYSETFKKLKIYESLYPGRIDHVTKKELDDMILEIYKRFDEKPVQLTPECTSPQRNFLS